MMYLTNSDKRIFGSMYPVENTLGPKAAGAGVLLSAYLTVYLSLMLPVIFSLILVLLQGARSSAVKMKTECAVDISMNAVLSEFNRELFKQYDLLYVDMSYGGDHPTIANTTAHLRGYLSKNLNGTNAGLFGRDFLGTALAGADILEYSLASDNGGDDMRRQIGDYLHYTMGGRLGEMLPDGIDSLLGSGLLSADISGERQQNQAAISAVELPEEEVEPGKFEKVSLDNPADVANETRSGGVLSLVLSDTSSVSSRKVDLKNYISHRSISRGYGIPPEAAAISDGCNEILFQQYVFDKLGYYGHTLDKSVLKYQVEYLITGKDRDYDNLESICRKLLLIREAANVAYIFSDQEKVAEAEAWAATLSAVVLLPELLEPVKISLLFAWSYLESLQDIKILLDDGKLPLMKTAESWHTQLTDILNIRGSLRKISSSEGLGYKEYLYALLYLTGKNKKTFRLMDLMEMDIRKTPGNEAFRMDACLDSYLAHIYVDSRFGISTEIERRYGYYFPR